MPVNQTTYLNYRGKPEPSHWRPVVVIRAVNRSSDSVRYPGSVTRTVTILYCAAIVCTDLSPTLPGVEALCHLHVAAIFWTCPTYITTCPSGLYAQAKRCTDFQFLDMIGTI